MRKRKLGNSSLFVSELAIGSINFGGKVDTSSAIKILDDAYEKGINLVDTSEVYPTLFQDRPMEKQKKLSANG